MVIWGLILLGDKDPLHVSRPCRDVRPRRTASFRTWVSSTLFLIAIGVAIRGRVSYGKNTKTMREPFENRANLVILSSWYKNSSMQVTILGVSFQSPAIPSCVCFAPGKKK